MFLRRKNKLIVAAGIVIVGALAGIGAYAFESSGQTKVSAAAVAPKLQQGTTISYTGEKGVTALTQLKQVASGVITKSSSYGEYVDSIGGYKGGTGGKYWSFYVNGSLATVGADAYTSKGGEKIEWKFEAQ